MYGLTAHNENVTGLSCGRSECSSVVRRSSFVDILRGRP